MVNRPKFTGPYRNSSKAGSVCPASPGVRLVAKAKSGAFWRRPPLPDKDPGDWIKFKGGAILYDGKNKRFRVLRNAKDTTTERNVHWAKAKPQQEEWTESMEKIIRYWDYHKKK